MLIEDMKIPSILPAVIPYLTEFAELADEFGKRIWYTNDKKKKVLIVPYNVDAIFTHWDLKYIGKDSGLSLGGNEFIIGKHGVISRNENLYKLVLTEAKRIPKPTFYIRETATQRSDYYDTLNDYSTSNEIRTHRESPYSVQWTCIIATKLSSYFYNANLVFFHWGKAFMLSDIYENLDRKYMLFIDENADSVVREESVFRENIYLDLNDGKVIKQTSDFPTKIGFSSIWDNQTFMVKKETITKNPERLLELSTKPTIAEWIKVDLLEKGVHPDEFLHTTTIPSTYQNAYLRGLL